MSAITAITATPIATERAGQRPRLVLVPTGQDASGMQPNRRPAPLRLTARGRIVLSLLVALALIAVALVSTGAFASAAPQPRTITVQAGQTLSGIAAANLPDLAVTDAIVEIQLANALPTDQVHAGQTLVIPVG